MNEQVRLSVFYPHPVEKVWQALSDRRILNAWMMNNDFEPRLGHKFKFERKSLPGVKTVIDCEVVELKEPKRLAYTWQDGLTSEPSLVIWTLTSVEGGTQLQIQHLPTSYATAFVDHRHEDFNKISDRFYYKQPITHFEQQISAVSLYPMAKDELSCLGDRSNFKQDWDYCLNHQLPEALAHYSTKSD